MKLRCIKIKYQGNQIKYARIVKIENGVITINFFTVVMSPCTSSVEWNVMEYIPGLIINIDQTFIITADHIINDILVLHESCFTPVASLPYFPGMCDIFYITQMKLNGIVQNIDKSLEQLFSFNFIDAEVTFPTLNFQIEVFQIYQCRILLAKEIKDCLSKQKSSNIRVGPLHISSESAKQLFKILDEYNSGVSIKHPVVKHNGLYQKQNDTCNQVIYHSATMSKVITSVEPLKGWLGEDWFWTIVYIKTENRISVTRKQHSIRQVRSNDKFSRIEISYDLVHSTITLNLKVLTLVLDDNGVPLESVDQFEFNFDDEIRRHFTYNGQHYLVCNWDYEIEIGRSSKQVNQAKKFIYAINANVYNDLNYRHLILDCINDKTISKDKVLSNEAIKLDSFIYSSCEASHPLTALQYKYKSVWFDTSVNEPSASSFYFKTEIVQCTTINQMCESIIAYTGTYKIKDTDILQSFIDYQLNYNVEHASNLKGNLLISYFIECFKDTCRLFCPSLFQEKVSRLLTSSSSFVKRHNDDI